MRQVTRSLRTKADRVRALAAAGYTRQKIASFLGIRYQHVRNVLVRSAPARQALEQTRRPRGLGEPAPEAWEAGAPDEAPTSGRVVVDEEGRIALPAHILAALDSGPGGRIPWHFEDGELTLMSRAAGIRSAQALVAELWKDHPISSDALIAERRAEAAREDTKFKRRRRG